MKSVLVSRDRISSHGGGVRDATRNGESLRDPRWQRPATPVTAPNFDPISMERADGLGAVSVRLHCQPFVNASACSGICEHPGALAQATALQGFAPAGLPSGKAASATVWRLPYIVHR